MVWLEKKEGGRGKGYLGHGAALFLGDGFDDASKFLQLFPLNTCDFCHSNSAKFLRCEAIDQQTLTDGRVADESDA